MLNLKKMKNTVTPQEILSGNYNGSQKEQILAHLLEHGNITSWYAITAYHITRLSAIIYNLRDDGYDIRTEMIYIKKSGISIKRWAKYSLNGQLRAL